MTEALKGKTPEEAEQTFEKFHGMLTRGRACPQPTSASWRCFPASANIRCASNAPRSPGIRCAPRCAAKAKPSRRSKACLKILRGPVIEALKTVYDPEIPVNIYELGLIYDIQIAR